MSAMRGCALVSILLFWGAARAAPQQVPHVELTPNPEQRTNHALRVRMKGGAGVIHLLILPDCDRDGAPDAEGTPTCPTPLQRQQVDLGQGGEREVVIPMKPLSPQVPLFLRVALDPSGLKIASRDVYLPVLDEPCGGWGSVLSLLGLGPCADSNYRDILAGARSDPDEGITEGLIVYRRSLASKRHADIPIRDTLGATGVAVEPDGSLLVTLLGARPGLYRLAGERRTLLVAAPKDSMLIAPLALGAGEWAYVEVPQRTADDGVMATLVTHRTAGVQRIALYHSVQQLLRYLPERQWLLLASRASGAPRIFLLDLSQQRESELSNGLEVYVAALRHGTALPLPLRNRDRMDWTLRIVTPASPLRDLAGGRLPALSPEGKTLYYLAPSELTTSAGKKR